MRKRLFSVLTVFLISLSLSVYAHSGRTDSSGGHKDNKNKSGLGYYHYHCNGNPPHLHSNGVCPYNRTASSSSSTASSSSSSTASYSGSSSVAATPQKTYATDITETDIPAEIDFGESTTLKATVYPENAEDNTLSWKSSDPDILKVSSLGELTAVGIGTATITAMTAKGFTKNFTITVKEVEAKEINIVSENTDLLIENTGFLECKFIPDNTTDKTVRWLSSDESVLKVSSDGRIHACGVGTATISAIHKNLIDSIDIEVKPIDATKITIIIPSEIELSDEWELKLKKGTQTTLRATISPSNATYKDIEWSVNNSDIASIDKDGNLTTHSTGNIIVTATTKNGVDDEIQIKIYSHTGKIIVIFISFAALLGLYITIYIKKKRAASPIPRPNEAE